MSSDTHSRRSPAPTLTATRERALLVGLELTSRRAPASAAAQAASAAQARAQVEAGAGEFGARDSLAELRQLALSAGAEIAGEFLQSRMKPDAATLIGRGKLEEIAGAAAAEAAAVVIFDHELTPSQQRNLEAALGARVIDRSQLILDIFARHARSREGQLQVELAQLRYLLPRLAGRGVEMSQLGGGIGTRGPGETQLETDRRRIFRRLRQLEEQIEGVRRTRAQQRRRRESAPVPTVALVGYTNAGKSTLFNALTRAGVEESARMFATLDPTLRALTLPSRRQALLSDTVGFIRNLPHTLVSAFRATLEEVERADLLLEVCDATSPHAAEQQRQVQRVLEELGAGAQARLRVRNKIDLLPAAALGDGGDALLVSARTGAGLQALVERLDQLLERDPLRRARLRIPQGEGKALALLEAGARIAARRYRDGAVEAEAQLPQSLLRRLERFVVRS